MSNRLTNDMRDKIAYNAIKHRFAAPIADLRKRRATLAERVYEDIFRRCRDQMYALPDGWLPEASHVEVKLGATHTQLNFNGDFRGYYNSKASEIVRYCGVLEAIEKRFPAKNARRCSGVYDAGHDFSIEYDRLANEKADLNEKIGKVRQDTRATLGKFTTVDKLLEAWPEIEPFTKGVAPTPPAKLPMVPVSHLNEALGLPVEEDDEDGA